MCMYVCMYVCIYIYMCLHFSMCACRQALQLATGPDARPAGRRKCHCQTTRPGWKLVVMLVVI